jgi:hypothetical protein
MPFSFCSGLSRIHVNETFGLVHLKESAMNSRFFIVAITTAIFLPLAAHAQTNGSSVTRQQVRADLIQLERAGYQPGRANNPHYPDDLLAAEARIHASTDVDPYAANATGGTTAGTWTSAGRVASTGSENATFSHH